MANTKSPEYYLHKSQKAVNAAQPIIRLYELYSGGQATDFKYEAAKDIGFVNTTEWRQTEVLAMEAANQPITNNNEIKPVRDQVVNQITDNDPEWLAVPEEKSDSSMADEMSAFMHYIWESSSGRMHFRKACEEFLDTGLFVLHAYYDANADMGNGEIKVIRINIQDITIDPRCSWRNAQDSERIFLYGLESETKIKTMYPDFNFELAVPYEGDNRQYSNRATTNGQIYQAFLLNDQKYYRIIDSYSRIKMDMVKIYDPNSNFTATMSRGEFKDYSNQPAIILTRTGQEKVITEKVDIQKYFKVISTYGNTFHENTDGSISAGVETQDTAVNARGQIVKAIPGTTTQINVVTMLDLINEGKIKWTIVKVDRIKRELIVGDKMYRNYIMPISNYPFGITMLHHTDTPYPYGDVRLVRSIQEQINKINSLIIAYNTNITNVKVFVPKDSADKKDLEERWGKAGAQFFEFDPELGGIPVVVQLTQMTNAFYTQLDRLRSQIQRIYGAYEFQDGLVDKAPDTASGTNHLDEMGFRRSKGKLDLIEEALNDLGGVIAELIPFVYDQRKLIRVLLPNNKTKDIVFNEEVNDGDITRILNDLSTNRYDYKIKSGSTLPTNMAAQRAMALRMFELKAMKDPTPLLRLSGLPGIEEIIQNESLINQATKVIQQLQQTIKTVGGQLQTKTREKIHADERVEIEKTKAQLKELVSAAKHGVLLGKERINDSVKAVKNKMDELSNNMQQDTKNPKMKEQIMPQPNNETIVDDEQLEDDDFTQGDNEPEGIVYEHDEKGNLVEVKDDAGDSIKDDASKDNDSVIATLTASLLKMQEELQALKNPIKKPEPVKEPDLVKPTKPVRPVRPRDFNLADQSDVTSSTYKYFLDMEDYDKAKDEYHDDMEDYREAKIERSQKVVEQTRQLTQKQQEQIATKAAIVSRAQAKIMKEYGLAPDVATQKALELYDKSMSGELFNEDNAIALIMTKRLNNDAGSHNNGNGNKFNKQQNKRERHGAPPPAGGQGRSREVLEQNDFSKSSDTSWMYRTPKK